MRLDPREARNLLAGSDFLALATQSQRMPGFPFVSHAPFVRDGAGQLVTLLSRLAEHSRNLGGDPKVSAMATQLGGDPQSQPRVTLVGELRTASLTPAQQDRYLRYHPESGAFLGFGDFRFYRLEIARVRMVGGFARAGWIEPAEWKCRPLDERREAQLIAELQGSAAERGWKLIGLDYDGLDARGGEGERWRVAFRTVPEDDAALLACARNALSEPS